MFVRIFPPFPRALIETEYWPARIPFRTPTNPTAVVAV